MAGYVSSYTIDGITLNRGDEIIVNGPVYGNINASSATGNVSNEKKYFYGVYVYDDGTLPTHPLGLMNSANQGSAAFGQMNMDAIVSFGSSIVNVGAFKAYTYDTRSGAAYDTVKWFESVLLDFNSFTSPEHDPIIEYNLFYYQSISNNLSSPPNDDQYTGPYLIGAITERKTLGIVNENSPDSNWGDRGHWYKWGLQAVTQNGSKSLIGVAAEILRKSFAYKQVFNGNGSTSGLVKTLYQFDGYNINLPVNNFKKTGHTFAGWSLSANGSGETYFEGQVLELPEGKERNWWAKWTANKYALTINPNGGTWNGSTSSQTFTQNYGTTKDVPNPTRVGYTFLGWTLSGSGSLSNNVFTFGDGSATLTAKWMRIPCVITFNASANGGSPDSTKGVFYGDTVGEFPTVKKPYYKFIGWYTKPTGGSRVSIYDVITSNVTFYAQFKIDASVRIMRNGKKYPAVAWVKRGGVWRKCLVWIKKNGKWYKSTGAD